MKIIIMNQNIIMEEIINFPFSVSEGSNRTHWITLGVFLAATLSAFVISIIIW